MSESYTSGRSQWIPADVYIQFVSKVEFASIELTIMLVYGVLTIVHRFFGELYWFATSDFMNGMDRRKSKRSIRFGTCTGVGSLGMRVSIRALMAV